MTDDKLLAHYLATISHVLAGPVMNDLQTPQIKELTGIVLVLLGRLHTQLAAADDIAATAAPAWGGLRREAARHVANLPAATDSTRDRQAVETEISQLQRALGEPVVFGAFVEHLKHPGSDSAKWMRELSQWLASLARDMETRFSQGIAPPASAGQANIASGLQQKLDAYLAHRFPELRGSPIAAFSIMSGGQSKLSALLTLKPNAALPTQLALRLDIPSTTTPMQLADEYPVLKRVFELGLPVPEPLLFEPDATWLGGAFVLSRQITEARMAGSPFVEDRLKYGAATGPDFGREAAVLLAQLHGKTYEPGLHDDVVARERDALLDELAEKWRAMGKPPFTLQRDLSIAWLRAHPLPSGRPVCLVHGDFAQHNILTRDGKIAALLDWELARLGDPAEDLAQCKMMLIGGVIAWEEFLRIYHEHGGAAQASDPHAVAFYAVMLYLKHGVYQTQIRNKFVKGEGLDIKNAAISGHFLERLALYQAEALRDAIALVD